MGQRRKGARILGPYKERDGWRVVFIAEDGGRNDRVCATEQEAARVVRDLERELALESPVTVRQALDAYEVYQREKGNRPSTLATTRFRLRGLLREVEDLQLGRLTPERCGILYGALTARQAADTHRNALAEVKTWARWCVKQTWIRRSPWDGIEGTGARSPGKDQLRVDEQRRLLDVSLARAPGDDGAAVVAAALLLGLRAGELVGRVGRDLDDDGRLLWITRAKTKRGVRRVQVPEVLRPHLQRLATAAGEAGRMWPRRVPWVRHQVERLCGLAEVPTISAHGLRGSHATCAVDAGATPHLVAAALGQTSAAVTVAAYAQPEAVERQRQDRALAVLQGGRSRV